MQEELERKSISVTIQATKLTGRVMRAAVAAALRKIEKERTTPKVGRNSMRRLTAQTPDAHKIEVEDRIRSFERYAKKYKVRYYGLNAISSNLIMANRKNLKNPNGLFLGTPGSGPSLPSVRSSTCSF